MRVLFLFMMLLGCEPPSPGDLCREQCRKWASCGNLGGDAEAECVRLNDCDHVNACASNEDVRRCLARCYDDSCSEWQACAAACPACQ
jgi:hypothetical protein